MANEHTPEREYEPETSKGRRASADGQGTPAAGSGGEADLLDRLKRRGGDIALTGEVSERMARDLTDQLRDAEDNGEPLVIEVTTIGGDAEMARRMVVDIDRARERLKRRLVFLGTAVVYSAGTTIMSAFPRADRFLHQDAMVMIHCRQLAKTVELDGPIRPSKPKIEALLHQIDVGLELETRNFEQLIAGSDISLAELRVKALYNWYLTAQEARDRGLVGTVI